MSKSAIAQNEDYLDSVEQDELVQNLESEVQRQVRLNRLTFNILYLGIAVVFFCCLGYSQVYPYEMDHQEVFKDLIPRLFFDIYYVCMIIYFVLGAIVMGYGYEKVGRTAKLIGITLCAVFTVGWTLIFIQHQVTNPVLYWLPLTPLVAGLLALYIDNDLNRLVSNLEGLKHSKYDYKKA